MDVAESLLNCSDLFDNRLFQVSFGLSRCRSCSDRPSIFRHLCLGSCSTSCLKYFFSEVQLRKPSPPSATLRHSLLPAFFLICLNLLWFLQWIAYHSQIDDFFLKGIWTNGLFYNWWRFRFDEIQYMSLNCQWVIHRLCSRQLEGVVWTFEEVKVQNSIYHLNTADVSVIHHRTSLRSEIVLLTGHVN